MWLRGAVLLGAAYGAWRGVVAAPWALAPAAGVWLVASLYAKDPAELDEDEVEEERKAAPAAEGGTSSEEPEPAGAAPPAEEPPLPSHQDLHEALSRVGTPHAHIAVLAADLGTTAERVRAALAQMSIPVKDVRMKGRGSSTGIRGDRFPAPPAPLPKMSLAQVRRPTTTTTTPRPPLAARGSSSLSPTTRPTPSAPTCMLSKPEPDDCPHREGENSMHRDSIQHQMDLAEQTGRDGDPRGAASRYQALGKALQEQLGQYHPLALDAYEGSARWVRLGTHPPQP